LRVDDTEEEEEEEKNGDYAAQPTSLTRQKKNSVFNLRDQEVHRKVRLKELLDHQSKQQQRQRQLSVSFVRLSSWIEKKTLD